MNERSRLPPGQRVTKGFPVFTYERVPSDLAKENWELFLDGLVENPTSLSWQSLQELGPVDIQVDWHCVTRWSKIDMDWTGIPTQKIVELAKPKSGVVAIMAHSYGGYTTNLSMEDFTRKDSLIATSYNHKDLERDHGFPVRLFVPHLYAWKSCKWLHRIDFMDHEELGFWEQNGYHRRGDPWKEERYSS
jgi:DMSO/TMAO reductase YedYZ molybdopterin-dependent catalytic subunit